MHSDRLANPKNLSSWLVSFAILISLLGFSGSVNTPIAPKQTLTENVKRVSVSKTRLSFHRLCAELISKNFFDLLAQQHTRCSAAILKGRLAIAFQRSARTSDCTITFVEQIHFRFRARDIDTHTFLRA